MFISMSWSTAVAMGLFNQGVYIKHNIITLCVISLYHSEDTSYREEEMIRIKDANYSINLSSIYTEHFPGNMTIITGVIIIIINFHNFFKNIFIDSWSNEWFQKPIAIFHRTRQIWNSHRIQRINKFEYNTIIH